MHGEGEPIFHSRRRQMGVAMAEPLLARRRLRRPADGGVAGGGRHVLLQLLGVRSGAMLSFGNGHAGHLGHGDDADRGAVGEASQTDTSRAVRLAPNKPTADATGTNEQALRLQSARTCARTEEE